MKLCSFNVNSVKARKELLLNWLAHRGNDIDILCLQELKVRDEFFPNEDFEKLGFQCHVFGQKAYNGVAICSKSPLKDIKAGFGHEKWDQQKRFISAASENFTLINIYAPHGGERGEEKFEYKQGWYEHLLTYLNRLFTPQDPIIICGDLNIALTDIDVYSPSALADTIGTMPEERVLLQRLLEWGFSDMYRIRYPEDKQFTWWGYMGGAIWKNAGMRIDYVICTAPLQEKITALEVDMWPRKRRSPTPSDHAPLIANINKEKNQKK